MESPPKMQSAIDLVPMMQSMKESSTIMENTGNLLLMDLQHFPSDQLINKTCTPKKWVVDMEFA